jgi:rhodanese-related sulfurtransferase
MYFSLRSLIKDLPDDILIYPAHGAGSLCGKALSDAHSSTLGAEKKSNWSLGNLSEEEFVKTLIQDQPFTPGYFTYDVGLNQKGAPIMEGSLQHIPYLNRNDQNLSLEKEVLIIDTRPKEDYNLAHYPNSFNIMAGSSFTTWLGSIVKPNEPYYLLANFEKDLDTLLVQTADIGYDLFLKATLTMEGLPFEKPGISSLYALNIEDFLANEGHYTILDIRNPGEIKERPIFAHSLHIPLYQLRDRLVEIPLDKPIVVHCAAGYRSAAGVSILRSSLNTRETIYDFGEKIKEFIY